MKHAFQTLACAVPSSLFLILPVYAHLTLPAHATVARPIKKIPRDPPTLKSGGLTLPKKYWSVEGMPNVKNRSIKTPPTFDPWLDPPLILPITITPKLPDPRHRVAPKWLSANLSTFGGGCLLPPSKLTKWFGCVLHSLHAVSKCVFPLVWKLIASLGCNGPHSFP